MARGRPKFDRKSGRSRRRVRLGVISDASGKRALRFGGKLWF
jgi:hypothetical protein